MRSIIAGNEIIVGGDGIGVFRADANNANNWSLVNSDTNSDTINSLGIWALAYNARSKTIFIGSVNQGGIYRSTDFGKNWSISNSGYVMTVFPSGNKGAEVNSIIVDSTSGNMYFGTGWFWADEHQGGAGVWKSTDDGFNWKHIGLDSLLVFSVSVWNSTLYAATMGSGLFALSGDSTWTHIPSPAVGTPTQQGNIWFLYPTKYGLLVGFDNWGIGLYLLQGTPKAPKWTYLGLTGLQLQSAALDAQGYLYVGEQMGVWKSTMPLKNIVMPLDKTKITSQTPASLETVHMNVPYKFQVTASDPNNDSLTYVWKINGVIDSASTTNSMTYIFKKLSPTTTVSVVVTNPIGSSDSTSWSFTITGVAELTGLPKEFALSQNFPNPFNPSTIINYSVPKSSFVTIKIYDVLGREVETLVNEIKPTGNYSIQFNAAQLTSGVYFYRMNAGDFVQTKKLLLLK